MRSKLFTTLIAAIAAVGVLASVPAVAQSIDVVGTELFGFFRQYDLDRTGQNFEEINLGGIGARIKF